MIFSYNYLVSKMTCGFDVEVDGCRYRLDGNNHILVKRSDSREGWLMTRHTLDSLYELILDISCKDFSRRYIT